jgi:SAM-dependent methyltransferase
MTSAGEPAPGTGMNESKMDESLVASARVARRFALEHCPRTASGDCAWYHGVWQYFRALGVTKTAGGSAVFLGATLRSLAAGGDVRRALISGAADDAMSLLAIDAFRDAGKSLDLTVVDRCEAPLALVRWSAERLGASVTTHCSDVLTFDSTAPFDIVLTNSFLGAFDPARRTQLFARWASLLRPGGKLLFTNRLRPGDGHAQLGFTSDQAQVFCAAVRREAERAKADLGLDPNILEGWARTYTERYRSYPVRTVEEVLDLLRTAGFVPDRVDTARVAGRAGEDAVAGPSVAERADYVRLLATRT